MGDNRFTGPFGGEGGQFEGGETEALKRNGLKEKVKKKEQKN